MESGCEDRWKNGPVDGASLFVSAFQINKKKERITMR